MATARESRAGLSAGAASPTLLSCLVLKSEKIMSGPSCWCDITVDGLTFSLVVANTLQASVVLPRTLFTTWAFRDEGASQEAQGFGINLGILLECLRVLTGSEQQTLGLSFSSESSCLKLLMVEGAAVTECSVSTLVAEAVGECAMPAAKTASIMIESWRLTEALADFGPDDKEHPRLRLRTSLQPPQLSLTVASSELGCEIVYPPQALVSFDVSGEFEAEYSFWLLRAALRACKESQSDRTCVRLGDDGMLHLSVRVPCDTVVAGLFVTFLMVPLAPEEEIEEDAAMEDATGADAAQPSSSPPATE